MAKKIYYGGQAVIEGVMMRGPKNIVTVVRTPKGGLKSHAEPLAPIYTGWVRRAPLLRGVIILVESMVLGVKTLLYSSNVALEEEGEKISGGYAWLMVFISIAISVTLFFLAPLYLANLTKGIIGDSGIYFALIEGGIRMLIFLGYLKAMTFSKDIRRVFSYHGAEHMAVNAYEKGIPLEVAAIRQSGRCGTAHVRCGTSFLFAVLIISILLFALINPWVETLWLKVISRIVLVPVIAAVSYEMTMFGGRHADNVLVRTILTPGMWVQKLTTRPPDDSQLEVAITALKQVVAEEETAPAAVSDAATATPEPPAVGLKPEEAPGETPPAASPESKDSAD